MIWKILFIICAIILAYLQFGGLTNYMTIAEVNILLSYILSCVLIFILAYFYSLGWNKKLFSLKANNIIFSGIVLYIIFSMIMAVLNGIAPVVFDIKYNTAGTVPDSSIYLSTVMLLGLSALVLYSIMYSPVIIAYFKYKSRHNNMAPVESPYLKIFLTFFAANNILSIIYTLIMADFMTMNVWDIFIPVFYFYSAFSMIGLAYNIKFGPQKFWKITSIPAIILGFAGFFLSSDQLKELLSLNLIFNSYAALAGAVVFSIITIYVLYAYAFKNDVYKRRNTQDTEKA